MKPKEYWWFRGYSILDFECEKGLTHSKIFDFYEKGGTLTCSDREDAKTQINRIMKEPMKFTVQVPVKKSQPVPAFVDCATQPYPAAPPCTSVTINEDQLMNYASASISTPATETQDQRKYLSRRLDEVYNSKRDGLESKFGLADDAPPTGPKELADRLAAGKFIIRGAGDDAKNADKYRYWHYTDLIQWRDPARKADQEGFDAARKDLKAKKQEALDTIKIDEPKAGLEAIKALEAWTPPGAAN